MSFGWAWAGLVFPSMGVMFALLLGEIDLSIGSIVALSALVAAVVLWREKVASVAASMSNEVLGSIVDNLFLFDNWHLLWYVLPLVLVATSTELTATLMLARPDASARRRKILSNPPNSSKAPRVLSPLRLCAPFS